MDTSLEWKIVVGQRRFTSGHRTVGGEVATIMEEPSDRHHEKQKNGKRYDRRQTSLAFGSEWTALGCIDPNINNNWAVPCLVQLSFFHLLLMTYIKKEIDSSWRSNIAEPPCILTNKFSSLVHNLNKQNNYVLLHVMWTHSLQTRTLSLYTRQDKTRHVEQTCAPELWFKLKTPH